MIANLAYLIEIKWNINSIASVMCIMIHGSIKFHCFQCYMYCLMQVRRKDAATVPCDKFYKELIFIHHVTPAVAPQQR